MQIQHSTLLSIICNKIHANHTENAIWYVNIHLQGASGFVQGASGFVQGASGFVQGASGFKSHPGFSHAKRPLRGLFTSWRKRWDSNPRALADNRISSAARYDHFDTLPYSLFYKIAVPGRIPPAP